MKLNFTKFERSTDYHTFEPTVNISVSLRLLELVGMGKTQEETNEAFNSLGKAFAEEIKKRVNKDNNL
jgi:hypothetical protein